MVPFVVPIPMIHTSIISIDRVIHFCKIYHYSNIYQGSLCGCIWEMVLCALGIQSWRRLTITHKFDIVAKRLNAHYSEHKLMLLNKLRWKYHLHLLYDIGKCWTTFGYLLYHDSVVFHFHGMKHWLLSSTAQIRSRHLIFNTNLISDLWSRTSHPLMHHRMTSCVGASPI